MACARNILHSISNISGVLEDAQRSVAIERSVFSSSIGFNQTSGEVYLLTGPDEPQYFGRPSVEIDNAWEELLGAQFPALTESEASELSELSKLELWRSPESGHYHMT